MSVYIAGAGNTVVGWEGSLSLYSASSHLVSPHELQNNRGHHTCHKALDTVKLPSSCKTGRSLNKATNS